MLWSWIMLDVWKQYRKSFQKVCLSILPSQFYWFWSLLSQFLYKSCCCVSLCIMWYFNSSTEKCVQSGSAGLAECYMFPGVSDLYRGRWSIKGEAIKQLDVLKRSACIQLLFPSMLGQLKPASSVGSQMIYRLLLVSEEAIATDYWVIPQNVRQGSPFPEPAHKYANKTKQHSQNKSKHSSDPEHDLTQTQPNVPCLPKHEWQASFKQASPRQ